MAKETNQTNPKVEPLAGTVIEPETMSIAVSDIPHSTHVALPYGWSLHHIDEETLLDAPRHKKASDVLQDETSFIGYINRHKQPITSVFYKYDPISGKLEFQAVLDDHGDAFYPNWRGHKANFAPLKSVEWERWKESDGKKFDQAGFAQFIEENIQDITDLSETGQKLPSGTDMLRMATEFESNADKRYRSKINLSSGGVRLEFVDDQDEATRSAMEVFGKFRIGIRVFRGAEAGYPIDIRLRHNVDGGKVKFSYFLIRPDLVFERAAKDLIDKIKVETAVPVYAGYIG